MAEPPEKPKPSGFWRKCRTVFRHFRRLVIFAFLVLICAVVWLNQVGVPDFVKGLLVKRLRAHGIELEFSRLRLSLRRGLVATDVHVGRVEQARSPGLSLRQVQLRLNYVALLRGQLEVTGLVLRQGKLLWPLSPTNSLEVDQIRSDLRFQTNDTWSLDNFRANFDGMQIALSGDIAHAQALRKWQIFHGPSTNAAVCQVRVQTFADALRQIHFTGTPQVNVSVTGDARDQRSFRVHLVAAIPDADTPWGSANAVQLTARLVPPSVMPEPPLVAMKWGTNLWFYRVEWTVRLASLKSPKLNAQSVDCDGYWHAPELTVTKLSAELGGGQLDAHARLNVNNREFTFTNSSCFDPHAIAALMTEKTQSWLAQFSWTQPPALRAEGALILPAWTNRQPDWDKEVKPTIRISGDIAVTNAQFRGIAADSARGHFSYSNLVWRLSPLTVKRPEGTLMLSDTEDDQTKSFQWRVRGALAPDAIRPLLAENQAEHALEPFTFAQPLFLNADVKGRLDDANSLDAAGWAALTNFTIRGEAVSNVECTFHYTNRVVEFFQPRLQASGHRMSADRIVVDFNSWRIYFTNGFSTVDPKAVVRAIGPIPEKVMEPYHFGLPCPVRVNGYAPLRGLEDADLWFDIEGAPLDWLKLKTSHVTGRVHWLGETLALTNLIAEFCGGDATGFANFDFRPRKGVDYTFTASVTNADVHTLATDLSSPTNHLEGLLSGRFVMTSANSDDWHTWNGYGQAHLHDGLIWDVPIFGILSPVLNAIMPGLGSSRATDATAQFGMTNGVFFSDDLEFRSTMMRLQYSGTVDLQSHVNAHVTAQLLRNTWVVGPLLSTALWPVSKLFEYKITGTLQKPQTDPVYIPKVLLTPLHPLRSLEDILNVPGQNVLPLKQNP